MAPPIRCGSISGGSSIATRSVAEWKQFLHFFGFCFFFWPKGNAAEWVIQWSKTWAKDVIQQQQQQLWQQPKAFIRLMSETVGRSKCSNRSVGLLERYKNCCYSLVIFHFFPNESITMIMINDFGVFYLFTIFFQSFIVWMVFISFKVFRLCVFFFQFLFFCIIKPDNGRSVSWACNCWLINHSEKI